MRKTEKPRSSGPRLKIPAPVETAVLKKSRRRCALCFYLKRDLTIKHGQIAHLDHDRTNNAERNLVYLCLEHHSLFDSKTSQHKNFTRSEVRCARDGLYKAIAKGLLPERARAVRNPSNGNRARAAKQQRHFAIREYVASFHSPRIVQTHSVEAHLREQLPKQTKGMTHDQIKMDLYELQGSGVLKYHPEVDAWALADNRELPERWKMR
jgi:hypothetical protein